MSAGARSTFTIVPVDTLTASAPGGRSSSFTRSADAHSLEIDIILAWFVASVHAGEDIACPAEKQVRKMEIA